MCLASRQSKSPPGKSWACSCVEGVRRRRLASLSCGGRCAESFTSSYSASVRIHVTVRSMARTQPPQRDVNAPSAAVDPLACSCGLGAQVRTAPTSFIDTRRYRSPSYQELISSEMVFLVPCAFRSVRSQTHKSPNTRDMSRESARAHRAGSRPGKMPA